MNIRLAHARGKDTELHSRNMTLSGEFATKAERHGRRRKGDTPC